MDNRMNNFDQMIYLKKKIWKLLIDERSSPSIALAALLSNALVLAQVAPNNQQKEECLGAFELVLEQLKSSYGINESETVH